jgi:hypothetical protein
MLSYWGTNKWKTLPLNVVSGVVHFMLIMAVSIPVLGEGYCFCEDERLGKGDEKEWNVECGMGGIGYGRDGKTQSQKHNAVQGITAAS